MSKHTKGPWTAPSAGIWAENGCCMIASLGNRDVIASRRKYARAKYGDSIESNKKEMELLKADCQLIASAPDMFQALHDAREVMQTARRYFPKSIQNRDTFHLLNVLANSVEKAISKAEGRTI